VSDFETHQQVHKGGSGGAPQQNVIQNDHDRKSDEIVMDPIEGRHASIQNVKNDHLDATVLSEILVGYDRERYKRIEKKEDANECEKIRGPQIVLFCSLVFGVFGFFR